MEDTETTDEPEDTKSVEIKVDSNTETIKHEQTGMTLTEVHVSVENGDPIPAPSPYKTTKDVSETSVPAIDGTATLPVTNPKPVQPVKLLLEGEDIEGSDEVFKEDTDKPEVVSDDLINQNPSGNVILLIEGQEVNLNEDKASTELDTSFPSDETASDLKVRIIQKYFCYYDQSTILFEN